MRKGTDPGSCNTAAPRNGLRKRSARPPRSPAAPIRRALEQAPAIIWTTDANFRVTSCSGLPLRALHLKAESLIGKTLGECFKNGGPSARRITEHLQTLDDVPTNFDLEYKGRTFRVRVEALAGPGRRTVGTVGVAMDVTDQKRSEESIRYLASHDPLTGLGNYRALLEGFDKELQRSDRTGRNFALLLLDLDRLKTLNDRHGHLVGNRALCRLASVLKRTCRSIDISARYGGDEFGILLVETDRKAGLRVAQRIANRLASDGEEPALTVSIGIAVYPGDGCTVENLLAVADNNLYRNKLRSVLRERSSTSQTSDADAKRVGFGPERRRSERLSRDVPLLVRGESIESGPFEEETFTTKVSAHGALFILATKVVLGQKLVLKNLETQEETPGSVASFGSPYGGLAQVAIEFRGPAPEFWRIDPLPEGWKVVAEANRTNSQQADNSRPLIASD